MFHLRFIYSITKSVLEHCLYVNISHAWFLNYRYFMQTDRISSSIYLYPFKIVGSSVPTLRARAAPSHHAPPHAGTVAEHADNQTPSHVVTSSL